MKKLIITTAIILGLGMTSFADGNQSKGGIFQRGATPEGYEMGYRDNTTPMLPSQHGLVDHQDSNNSPLGSGAAVLIGLGAAYLVAKKRKED